MTPEAIDRFHRNESRHQEIVENFSGVVSILEIALLCPPFRC